jgi:hypothetical protein
MTSQLLRLAGIALLYLCASPVYFVKWAIAFIFADSTKKRPVSPLDSGTLDCPTCGGVVPLATLNECPTCGLRSASSLVAPCAHCGDGPFPFTSCPSCSTTIRVF